MLMMFTCVIHKCVLIPYSTYSEPIVIFKFLRYHNHLTFVLLTLLTQGEDLL